MVSLGGVCCFAQGANPVGASGSRSLGATRQLSPAGASAELSLVLGGLASAEDSASARQPGPGKPRLGQSLGQCKQCFLFFVFVIFSWDCKLEESHK